MARILVIDDDPNVRANLSRALEGASYQVSVAEDGKQALRLIEAESHDLVITDILMPTMDGLKVIEALGKLRPGLPIIAISGGGALPSRWLLYDAEDRGVIESIPKPFDLDTMLGVVRRILDGEAGEKRTD